MARTYGWGCDIGAFEVIPDFFRITSITHDSTTVSLRGIGIPDQSYSVEATLDFRDWIGVGGGISTARSFLRAGLVDRLHVAITPILLGRGERLWDELRGLELTHSVRSEVAESGTIHVTFSRNGHA